MKEFDNNKFCDDLIALRGKEAQAIFAEKIGVKRSTLSLLENGKQIPTIDILSRICDLSGKSTEEYFIESKTDALVYLMGTLTESDRVKIEEMAERIRIKERYELLSKRGSYVVN
jgi:transcriptional regulator with XRE-family HTH domain